MAGFTVQNFLSSATGICIAIAVMRGITRQSTDRIGNFWVDMTRCTLYILLPIAFIFALLLASQGVIQNLDPYVQATGYGPAGQQTIAMGPVASQEAIKEFGTNGGGFFNANSAHPYENPTPLTNLIEIFLILLIPVTLPLVFGRMIGNMRQGWVIYAYYVSVILMRTRCTLRCRTGRQSTDKRTRRFRDIHGRKRSQVRALGVVTLCHIYYSNVLWGS